MSKGFEDRAREKFAQKMRETTAKKKQAKETVAPKEDSVASGEEKKGSNK
jgi:hypothetical protein